MGYYTEEDELLNDDQLNDEVDVTMAVTGDDSLAREELKEFFAECCADDETMEDVTDVDVTDIDPDADLSEVEPKPDELDMAADDLIDAVEDITYSDFEMDELIDTVRSASDSEE
jgi:hypothetical protein|nr:MAG TPA: hypothetical protein [Caudoviricetes sp.]